MRKNILLPLTAAAMLSGAASAQTISENLDMDTPEWAQGTSLGVSFVTEDLDYDGGVEADAQGAQLELAKNFALPNLFTTTTALTGKLTSTGDDEPVEIDNRSVGVSQRLSRAIQANTVILHPNIGAGINYGESDFTSAAGDSDLDYISYQGEVGLTVETTLGVAPFVKYSYEIADLEDTSDDLEINRFSGGLSMMF